ncbi:endonuclease III domain-containing protein [Catalinimonas niigatensis]|uniref:endonuclease III domain-containing protein n=1 Tax=Catalinimonas niigatensis TaxID=1397264 RepID=UPI002665AB14|nr:endonuclease III [Catalinimonas niigatensis]WPP52730.1 endonuclease III [Catalinimonas niigatensis]
MPEKDAFDIERAMVLLREEVKDLPKAALFDLYDQGYTSLFEQLIACMISVRTYDEVTVPTSLRLFQKARTPEEMLLLSVEEIDTAIQDSTFHEGKARQIRAIAETIVKEHGGQLPCDFDTLLSFKGIGPKCANLALGIACQQMRIGVDIHVHRVTNRWGYVQARTPEKTMLMLEEKLPEQYRVEINRLLVPFGKHICKGLSPLCSQCTLLFMCQQVGVTHHR